MKEKYVQGNKKNEPGKTKLNWGRKTEKGKNLWRRGRKKSKRKKK